jgi:hypothetical protein
MPADFDSLFTRLRAILQKHQAAWSVFEDSATCYSLAGKVGPATLRAWGGKLKRPVVPVAWVQIGKAYVSYHLMGLYGNAPLLAACKARPASISQLLTKRFSRNWMS